MKLNKWTAIPNRENSPPNQATKFKSELPPHPTHNLVQFLGNNGIYYVSVPAVFFTSFTNLSNKQFIFFNLNFFFLGNLSHQIFCREITLLL